MASKDARKRKLEEIREIAEGWGKIIAKESFPEGPGSDVTLADMEEVAMVASRALVRGAVEAMAGSQGERLGKEVACPTCGKMCSLEVAPRRMFVRGGEAVLREPVGHCSRCRRDFFPAAAVVESGRPRI